MARFTLEAPAPVDQPIHVKLALDNDGDIGLFYNGIQVGALGCLTGQFISLAVSADQRALLESQGVAFTNNDEIVVC